MMWMGALQVGDMRTVSYTHLNQHLRRHTAKLEEIHFLAIEFEDACTWIWQANEWHSMLFPIISKGGGMFRANDQHFNSASSKFVYILAQLRHMRMAKWSTKAAIKDEQHMFVVAKIGETDHSAIKIR